MHKRLVIQIGYLGLKIEEDRDQIPRFSLERELLVFCGISSLTPQGGGEVIFLQLK